MAFTVTARHDLAPTTTSGTTRTSSSVTPSANSLLVVVSGGEENNISTATTLNAPSGGGLTYTERSKVDAAGAPNWEGSNTYQLLTGVWTAPVGGSPSAFTLTQTTSAAAYIFATACDITGHDAGAPVVRVFTPTSAAINPNSSAASRTITLSATPTTGNLVVLAIGAGADTGGGFAVPTAGAGKSFTAGSNQNGGYAQGSLWYRVWDGSESLTVTCSDLGDTVGNYAFLAFEVAAGAGVAEERYGPRLVVPNPAVVRAATY